MNYFYLLLLIFGPKFGYFILVILFGGSLDFCDVIGHSRVIL